MLKGFIPSSPNTISPIPISSKSFMFRPFFFRPFQLRHFPISSNICPALLPFYPISFSPIFHFAQMPSRTTFPFRPFPARPLSISPSLLFGFISPNDHVALFPQRPFLFSPSLIFGSFWT